MTNSSKNFAKALFELNIPEDTISQTRDIFLADNELIEVLSTPAVTKSEKHKVIDTLFAKEIRSFIKVLCEYDSIKTIGEILDEYEAMALESKNMIKATFTYVTKPDENQIRQIKEMVCSKFGKAGVVLELKEDPELIGGFILTVGDTIYDKSIKGNLADLTKTLAWR